MSTMLTSGSLQLSMSYKEGSEIDWEEIYFSGNSVPFQHNFVNFSLLNLVYRQLIPVIL